MQKASRSMGGKSKSLLPSHKQKPFGNRAAGRAARDAPGPAWGEAARSTYRTAGPRRPAPVPAEGVREGPWRPALRSPPRALERGGSRRRHNRKFMAWVTCFPLPQWGPVTLNRKLMREERNLISPLCALRREGAGDARQSDRAGRRRAWRPAPHASSRIRAPGPWAGEGTATLAPGPLTLRLISGASRLPSVFPGRWSGKPSSPGPLAPRAQGPDGGSDVPPPRPAQAQLPNSGTPIGAELPSPTAWSQRREQSRGPRLPSPHPEQVTTRAATAAAAPRRLAGPERPLFARGTAPLGRSRRLLAPTPPRRVLKGATRPAGLCPVRRGRSGRGGTGAAAWPGAESSLPIPLRSGLPLPCPPVWGGRGPAATPPPAA